MGQLRYNQNQVAAVAGMPFDDTGHRITAFNLSPEVKQIVTVTVGTGGAQTMTLRINGFDSTAIGEGGDSTTDNAADLAAAINANKFISGAVVAEASAATVIVTSRHAGVAFTYSAEAGDLTPALTQANAQADPIPYGRLVLKTGNGGNTEKTLLGGLASAARLTAQVDTLTLTYDAAVDAIVDLEYYDPTIGQYVQRSFVHTQATDAATSLTALAAQINGVLPANTILADAAAAVLTLTAEVAGAMFRVTYGFGTGRDTGAWVHTTNAGTEATSIEKLALGILEYTATTEAIEVDGEAAVEAAKAMNIRRNGRSWTVTEDSDVTGKPVYVRLAANGTLDKLGGFRGTPNAGCVLLRGYEWFKTVDESVSGGRNLAVIAQL